MGAWQPVPERVAVTGASGFVGTALVAGLNGAGYAVDAFSRRGGATMRAVGSIDGATQWAKPLRGVTTVIHLAARVHVMADDAAEPLQAFRTVNVDGTRRLAEEAARASVRRLVFVSSVKVNGERTIAGRAFRENDAPAPADAYGQSKWEAEQALHEVAERTGLEVVILRPPLVYGPGVKANFERLMRWVARGLPLPLGAIDNRRSLLALDNLVDLLVHCVDHPAAAGRTFLVSDGEDLSTPELVRRLAAAMGRRPRLIPVPVPLLRAAGGLAGHDAEVARLCDSLQVATSTARQRLGWGPPVEPEKALEKTVRAFLSRGARTSWPTT